MAGAGLKTAQIRPWARRGAAILAGAPASRPIPACEVRARLSLADIRVWAGHARLTETLDTYTHVLVDDREVDRAAVLR